MPIETSRAGSPGWWFKRLLEQLAERQPRYARLDRYSRGDADLPWGPENSKEAFRRLQEKARANWGGLITEAVVERQRPVGFRTGVSGDDQTDAEAWRIWQANSLDADAPSLFRSTRAMSEGYVIIGGPSDVSFGEPLITVEDPRQVTSIQDPRNRRLALAALKVFSDDAGGRDLAYLYLPGVVYRVSRSSRLEVTPTIDGWEQMGEPQRLPYPVVPVVRFANRADLAGNALGEFEDVLSDIDRINLMLLQRLSTAVLQAFKQRAVKNVPSQDAQGNDIDYDDIFSAAPGAIWQLPEGAEMWESGAVDLTPLLESVKADVRDIAATTRTPMFYLFPDSANGSAEGASLQREGLVFKVSDRNAQDGESLELMMSLAFLFKGDRQRAQRSDMEVLWAPPERFSLAERADAASKAISGGVPWRTVMTDIWQFTPQQVDRMETERASDLFALQSAATNANPA